MKKIIFVISLICLSMVTRAEAFPVFGVDSVGSDFFNQWYLTTDLGHYLDNYSDYVVYEAETTGEWNTGDMNIFSIAGNSFRQNKYYYNGMRVNSRALTGHTFLYTNMGQMQYALNYHTGAMYFVDDTTPCQFLSMTGNMGNLGGISPGTKQLINLFHSSGEERTMDTRPIDMRNHIIGSGTLHATFAIPSQGHQYYQHVYANVGWRAQTAFDHTGITDLYTKPYYTVQLDGQVPT